MSASDPLEEILASVRSVREKLPPHPEVFRMLDPDPDVVVPSHLQELAVRTAAQREFCGELLSRARKSLALAEVVLSTSAHDVGSEMDRKLAEAASQWIARGYAWPERQAKANLSVLERRVEHRGVDMRVAQIRSIVAEIEDCYRAWRDTEWSLDRVAKLLALRHQLGEV